MYAQLVPKWQLSFPCAAPGSQSAGGFPSVKDTLCSASVYSPVKDLHLPSVSVPCPPTVRIQTTTQEPTWRSESCGSDRGDRSCVDDAVTQTTVELTWRTLHHATPSVQ